MCSVDLKVLANGVMPMDITDISGEARERFCTRSDGKQNK